MTRAAEAMGRDWRVLSPGEIDRAMWLNRSVMESLRRPSSRARPACRLERERRLVLRLCTTLLRQRAAIERVDRISLDASLEGARRILLTLAELRRETPPAMDVAAAPNHLAREELQRTRLGALAAARLTQAALRKAERRHAALLQDLLSGGGQAFTGGTSGEPTPCGDGGDLSAAGQAAD